MSGAITSESHVRQGGRFLPSDVKMVLGDLRGRVDGDIVALSFAAGGRVQTVEDGGLLRHWDVKTGGLIQSFPLSEVETTWAFSKNGRFLASGGRGLSLWDASRGELLGEHDDPSWMTSLVFSPDASMLATGHDDHKVRLWNSRSGKLMHVLNGHSEEVSAVTFSADGRFLATAGEDRLVLLWDTRTGDRVGKLEGHTDRVDDLAFSPNGHRLASAGWDTSVRIWDPKRGELLALLNGQGECVHAVQFTPDGRWIVCCDSDGFVRVWDYERLRIQGEYRGHLSAARRLAVRGDGKLAATGGTDRRLRIVRLPDADPVIDDDGPNTNVVSIAPTTRGRVVVVHGEGSTIAWDTNIGIVTDRILENEHVLCVASDGVGRTVVGTMKGEMIVYGDISESPLLSWKGHNEPIQLIQYRPDGKEIASSSSVDGTVRIWDPATGEPTLIIPEAAGKGTVEAIAYHPSEPIVGACGVRWGAGVTGHIRLWNTRDIKLIRTIEMGATAIAFSPNGRFLAAVTVNDRIIVWNLANGEIVREIPGSNASTNAIAFDPTSQFLVSGSDDMGLRSWDTNEWRMRSSTEVDTRVRCMAFLPTGDGLLIGNANSSCYVIDPAGLG